MVGRKGKERGKKKSRKKRKEGKKEKEGSCGKNKKEQNDTKIKIRNIRMSERMTTITKIST